MAQVVVRKLDDEVKERLRERAARNGHSMEEEIREILRAAVAEEAPPVPGLGTQIAALFADIPAGPPLMIEELRGYPAVPWTFDWLDTHEDDEEDEGVEG